uniref:Cytochrome c biogenesis protein CcsA n=1 Tax=Anthoceros agrestis TaxID=41834 RepID=A0A6M8ATA3_9EMBR|nr:putative cytochrome-c synthesis associated protein [Anthoceros agrestis]QKD76559.1 putative cytochrome-c synthesis associated protein [Anthoceros agrestis]
MILINLEHILAHIPFFLPFLATLVFWGRIVCIDNKRIGSLGNKSIIIAYICITGLLLTCRFHPRHLLLSNLYEFFMFLSWSFCLIHIVSEIGSKNDWLGIIIVLIAMLTHGFATVGLPIEMQQSTVLVPASQSHWLIMHVSMMIPSYATLLCGFLLVIALSITTLNKKKNFPILKFNVNSFIWSLILEKKFDLGGSGGDISSRNSSSGNGSDNDSNNNNKKTFHSLSIDCRKLQLTQQLDYWSYRIISLGSLFLTIGILSGAVWVNEAWGSYWSWDPKETWALITWLLSAIHIHIRMIRGWQGEKPAIIASSGSSIVWFRYLGVNSPEKGLHSYGWLN